MKKIVYFMAAVLSLYFLLFVYLYFYTAKEYSGYKKPGEQRADALVVFFGDFDDNGELSSESLRRLSFAVDLYKKDIGKNIIFVGGYRPARNVHGSEFMAARAIEMGVRPGDIFHDTTSRDTLHNWEEAEKIISGKNFKKVVLVSSVFHLLRIEEIIRVKGNIETSCLGYAEDEVLPEKSLLESFREYNYNVISIMAYLVLPDRFYQDTIGRLRS